MDLLISRDTAPQLASTNMISQYPSNKLITSKQADPTGSNYSDNHKLNGNIDDDIRNDNGVIAASNYPNPNSAPPKLITNSSHLNAPMISAAVELNDVVGKNDQMTTSAMKTKQKTDDEDGDHEVVINRNTSGLIHGHNAAAHRARVNRRRIKGHAAATDKHSLAEKVCMYMQKSVNIA
jgi:hypothetical protein